MTDPTMAASTKTVAVASAIAAKQGYRYAGLSSADKKFYNEQAGAAIEAADAAADGLALGKYRNRLGAELVVTGPFLGGNSIKILGSGIYHAEARDSLFGTNHYLVTASSLREAGHQLVEVAE